MDNKLYWADKHKKYSTQDWIDKPTIFSQFAVSYFPKLGRLLDLGAGQGQDSRFFAGKGYKVTSTDFSMEALDISKSKTDFELNIDFETVDMTQNLPYESESFDIVYSHMAIHYFDNDVTQKLIDEIHRILKKDGLLVLLLNSKTDPEVAQSKLISEDLYETPSRLVKRFFDEDSLSKFTSNKFETILLDSKGETYKDEIKTLIRYIGKKTA